MKRMLIIALVAAGALAASTDAGASASWCVYDHFSLGDRDVRGLAFSAGHLWVTHANPNLNDMSIISEMDPATHQVLRESGEFHWNARSICVALGSLWVADAYEDRIHRVDPVTFQEISSFGTPGTEPVGITYDGRWFWLTDPWRGRIDMLDSLGNVVGGFGIPNWYRYALEWIDASDTGPGMWTNHGPVVLTKYGSEGQTLDTGEIFGLPQGTEIFDVAFGMERMFASAGRGGEVYVLYCCNGEPSATRPSTWGNIKALYAK